jgi:hypothetical protein
MKTTTLHLILLHRPLLNKRPSKQQRVLVGLSNAKKDLRHPSLRTYLGSAIGLSILQTGLQELQVRSVEFRCKSHLTPIVHRLLPVTTGTHRIPIAHPQWPQCDRPIIVRRMGTTNNLIPIDPSLINMDMATTAAT